MSGVGSWFSALATCNVMFLIVPDFLIHTDTLDCLVFPSSYFPPSKLHTFHDMDLVVRYNLDSDLCTIHVRYNLAGLSLYNINLRATTTTSLSTRGVMIPINLVISTTGLFMVYHSSI